MNHFTLKGLTSLILSILGMTTCNAQTFSEVLERYQGLNLIAPLNSTQTSLVNNAGVSVHTWNSSGRPALAAYMLEDGALLRTVSTNNASFDVGGSGGRVELIGWDGEILWSYELSSSERCLHHDVALLPNGNILMLAWERKTENDAIAAGRDPSTLSDGELWSDMIIEVEPTGSSGGTIVWEWHAWDHLVQDYSASKPNYGTVSNSPERIDLNYTQRPVGADWHHCNSIDYNAELDQILVSVRNFSEIWILDHGTTTAEAAGNTGGARGKGGDLLYRWGNPQTYDRGSRSDQTLFVQHDAKWIDAGLPGAGDILVFNNGQGRLDGNYSSVDQFTPALNAAGGYDLQSSLSFAPTVANWSYTASNPGEFYAQRISGAQRLSNGDTLICAGTEGRVFEVNPEKQTVWTYETGLEVFRVERYSTSSFIEDSTGSSGSSTGAATTPTIPGAYPVVDSSQVSCFNNSQEIAAPALGASFYGQDAQFTRNPMSYTASVDGLTVYDNVTGLIWTQTADLNRDGAIDNNDKLTYAEALSYADQLSQISFGGHSDWRLPSIKELYSLMNFTGEDISGANDYEMKPFVDTHYFGFGYGDESAGQRAIDAQFASSTIYGSKVMNRQQAMFGLNLADGRIKGYPTSKSYYVYFVCGNADYGRNAFADNGNGTVSDTATGLMWTQEDSGMAMSWQDAFDWVQRKNNESYLGHSDWRLPNAKELQSIVDYTRSPDATSSAAIDALFNCSEILNEAGQADFPWYWSSTTHINTSQSPGRAAVYVCFGRAMGYMNGNWMDVHGAGAQRSDKKEVNFNNLTFEGNGYYNANSPQGDASRLTNYVRLVRDL